MRIKPALAWAIRHWWLVPVTPVGILLLPIAAVFGAVIAVRWVYGVAMWWSHDGVCPWCDGPRGIRWNVYHSEWEYAEPAKRPEHYYCR